MTVRGAGPDGVLRSATFAKGVGPDSVLRTASFIKIVGPDGVLRTIYTAGGSPPPAQNTAVITPASKYLAGAPLGRSYAFTASSSSGVAPTSYSWGVLDADGYVQSGASSATATLVANAATGESGGGTFYCDMVIGGQTYRATCEFLYQNTSGRDGGPLQ